MSAQAVAGPPAETAQRPSGEDRLRHRLDKGDLVRTVFVGGCAAAVGAGVTWPWPAVPLVAVVGLIVGCLPILTEAWQDVRGRRMSMELSMLIAIAAAAAIGEWLTALVITAFVLAAEILEDLSMDRGRDALTDLMSFLPTSVTVRTEAGTVPLPLSELTPGRIVVLSPGAKVPVDGVVIAGRSSLDESRITGESLPVEVQPGNRVYAGSINHLGGLEVRAERVGAQSSYGQIVEAVRAAQSTPAPAQRLADRLAGYIVYVALGAAALTWILSRDLTATISVVVVAGACGIAAGTPLAILAAIARAARTGVFVKGGAHLEALSAVDTVVFDKTGTLTQGSPEVVGVRPAAGSAADDVLRLAAAAESYSEHPLGRAIVAQARARGLAVAPADDFEYRPGLGVSAVVAGRRIDAGTVDLVPAAGVGAAMSRAQDGSAGSNAPAAKAGAGPATSVHVAVDGGYAGTIALADGVRDCARDCVQALHGLGLRVLMLTGDRRETAEAIARDLGIDDVRAELLPAGKQAAVAAERSAGHRIAMVGDGVNDAPALAAADVGIAMGSGTEIARESADVVLIGSDLGDLARTLVIARRARRIIMANFVGTLVVDLAGILLAAVGVLGPVPAALVHVTSETAFILNSARLIPARRRER